MPSMKLIMYVLFCIFIGLGGVVRLFKMDRTISAVVYLILTVLIFTLFGLRWFGKDGGADSTSQWPPVVNMCPDYLTAYTLNRSDGTKIPTCIDTVGVSKNCRLKLWPKDAVMPPGSDDYYFPLDGTMEEKCKRAKDYGLSWEACDIFSPSGKPVDPNPACPSSS